MPILANATKAVTDRMPKVISPGVHAIIDYATAGTFFAMGALFWSRNKRAAVSSLPGLMQFTDEAEARFFGMQAIAMAGVTGLTDFEGSGRTRQLKRLQKKAA